MIRVFERDNTKIDPKNEGCSVGWAEEEGTVVKVASP